MSCQFQTVHERQILFRDQDVDPPLTCASLVPGFQTMPGLKNAKLQIAKQIARELTEPRTVGIFRQQDCRRKPVIACHAMNVLLITLAPREVYGKIPGRCIQLLKDLIVSRKQRSIEYFRGCADRSWALSFSP